MLSFQELPNNLHRQRFAYYWWVLSFQGGAINAGGVLSCGRTVSHVTGFGTYFGTNAAQGRWALAWGLLSVPLFFLTGAVTTTVLRIRSENQHASVAQSRVMFIIMLLLASVFILGHLGFLGAFNAPVDLAEHFLLLIILSFVCGMQNAIFSNTPSGVIRSTHLTGPLTDFGADLGRFLMTSKWTSRDKEMVICRSVSIVCFVLGGLISSYFYLDYDYMGFVLPFLTSLLLCVDAVLWNRRHLKHKVEK
jgi:uncharacterized membrane protein YoaK (UPF0700 family)